MLMSELNSDWYMNPDDHSKSLEMIILEMIQILEVRASNDSN